MIRLHFFREEVPFFHVMVWSYLGDADLSVEWRHAFLLCRRDEELPSAIASVLRMASEKGFEPLVFPRFKLVEKIEKPEKQGLPVKKARSGC